MPHTLKFYPEQHILNESFSGDVTLDEMRNANEELLKVVESAEAPFHMLIDLRQMQKFPTSITQMKNAMHSIDDPKLRWIIMITNSNVLVKFVTSVLTQVMVKNARFRQFGSYGEAVAFLEDMDSTLDLSELLPELEALP